jgi:hypothetical protein
MDIDSQILSLEQDTKNYNVVKEVVINQLIQEGLLSDEDGEDFINRCQVVVVKNGWFKTWCTKLGFNKDDYSIRILEMYKHLK